MSLLKEYPQLKQLFAKITPVLTNATMRSLNAKVDVQGQQPADVALRWMVSRGLVNRV